jgi:hypothetical protein
MQQGAERVLLRRIGVSAMSVHGPNTARRIRSGFVVLGSEGHLHGGVMLRLGAQGIEQGYEIRLRPLVEPLWRGLPDSVARRVLVLEDPAHISLGSAMVGARETEPRNHG